MSEREREVLFTEQNKVSLNKPKIKHNVLTVTYKRAWRRAAQFVDLEQF